MLLAFWKPYGVLTKFTDPEGRPTLADFIDVPNVYPIGRLDRDSEGLLLLSDDGALAHRLTDPRHAHPRTYAVQVERVPDAAALRSLAKGVVLNDGPTRPALARLLDEEPPFPPRDPPIRHRLSVPTAWIELTLTEGRNRQVRRMTAAVGHPTLRLVRSAIGELTLASLSIGPGQWHTTTLPEVGLKSRDQTPRGGRNGSRSGGFGASVAEKQPDFGERLRRSPGTSRSARRGGGGSRS